MKNVLFFILAVAVSGLTSISAQTVVSVTPGSAPDSPVTTVTIGGGTPPLQKLSFQDQDPILLTDSRCGHQLIVTDESGKFPKDVTHQVKYLVAPEGILLIDENGYIQTIGNGAATITATLNGTQITLPTKVSGQETTPSINFSNEVIPLFTKYGCNGGGCHGKSGGQRNFRLSLFGYEPWNDHDWLVREARGRRLSPAAPENSLLLMKATGEIPHEGGIRLIKDSADYATLTNWIRQGMQHHPDKTPKVEKITVFPTERVAEPESHQQLAVIAYFNDGTIRDISRTAIYEANQEAMAEVDEHGLVTLKSETGSTSVMVRFQEHVAVYRATIPLGATMPDLPEKTNFIDENIFSKLSLLGLPPSKISDDTSFVRRVTIDIVGRLPTTEEIKAFTESSDPEKRSKKIDSLLDSPDYAAYFSQKWAGILRNKRTKDTYQRGTYAFHDWVRTELDNNTPYDQFVAKLVTASGEVGRTPAVAWYRSVKDNKEQMQDLAQIFLGIRMQCAQCHHHPYEKWSQDDYYGFVAFFTTVGRKPGEQPDEEIIYHKRVAAGMQNPNTKQTLKPTALGAKPLDLDISQDPRQSLADWLVSKENPYFAKMLVNRYWKHFFSTALVEPEDDMRVTNPASHPALLDDLAKHFVDSGFDMKGLIRTICNSRTYQLSSDPNEHNVSDSQNFSRFYPKRLQAEVLLDAIDHVSKSETAFTNQPAGVTATRLPDDKFNNDSYFLTVFGRPEMDSACECERVDDANLAQSLHLINSGTMQQKLSANGGRAALLAKATDRPDPERIGEIYLHAVSRQPNQAELQAAQTHLANKRAKAVAKPDDDLTPEKAEREAFEDILWALLNTKEFLFNH